MCIKRTNSITTVASKCRSDDAADYSEMLIDPPDRRLNSITTIIAERTTVGPCTVTTHSRVKFKYGHVICIDFRSTV